MPERPNILWICTDQQRYDTLRTTGNSLINTPNLDRLAEEGALATHMFSQSPVCTPSRASFLTGRYPCTTRARQNGQAIPADEVLISKILADAGYDCGLSGKLHLSPCCGFKEERIDDGYRVFHWSHHPSPNQLVANEYIEWLNAKGFEWKDVFKPTGYAHPGVPAELNQTTWCAEKAIEFFSEKRDQPWMFSVNMFDPHHPFDPAPEFFERYDPDQMPPPRYVEGELDNKPRYQFQDHSEGAYAGSYPMAHAKMSDRERREVTAAYYAMVELIDDQVGRMLKALDESGQRENTIVIFTSDHGEMLGDHGIYLKGPHLYDCAVRVPFIIRWPGHFKPGVRSDALLELVDLAPTLLDAIGMDIPDRMQGKSFLPILTGAADPGHHRDSVYCEYYNAVHPAERKAWCTMWRDRQYKIIVFHGEELGELYDLEADPYEHKNLWNDPEMANVKLKLMKACLDSVAFTMDPHPPKTARW
jgi:arylsulfatase